MYITNILKTRDGFNAVSICYDVKDNDLIAIGTMCDEVTISGHSMQQVAKYADIALRSINILYGKPVVKCKYDDSLSYLDIYSVEISVEEPKNERASD